MEDEESACDPRHPDSAIRLASTVHRFHLPEMGWGKEGPGTNLSFVRSFRTSGQLSSAKAMTRKADACRLALAQALSEAGKLKHANVIAASRDYLPMISQILASCKAYPEAAVLDSKLEFSWKSGVEKNKKSSDKENDYCKSEAIMYELVMAIVCEGLGHAGSACDNCVNGKFANSSKSFKIAAGIFEFLATVQLPKWVSRGNSVTENDLPAECAVGVCEALKTLFLGISQQMAVATVLVKPGKPNYILVAKLCLGICSLFEDFSRIMRNKSTHNSRFEKNFFVLLTFQVTFQKALTFYFQARDTWDKGEDHGLAIALLNEAISLMRTRASITSKGIPEIESKSSLRALLNDISDFRKHLHGLLHAWEYDNSTIYFCRVPDVVPGMYEYHSLKKRDRFCYILLYLIRVARGHILSKLDDKIIPTGTIMMKPETYKLDKVTPCRLALPTDTTNAQDESVATTTPTSTNIPMETSAVIPTHFSTIDKPPPPTFTEADDSQLLTTKQRPRSDSDIARELQAQMDRDDDLPPPYSVVEDTMNVQNRERSDSELARELQEKLNAGHNI